jgi:hypothetical protein
VQCEILVRVINVRSVAMLCTFVAHIIVVAVLVLVTILVLCRPDIDTRSTAACVVFIIAIIIVRIGDVCAKHARHALGVNVARRLYRSHRALCVHTGRHNAHTSTHTQTHLKCTLTQHRSRLLSSRHRTTAHSTAFRSRTHHMRARVRLRVVDRQAKHGRIVNARVGMLAQRAAEHTNALCENTHAHTRAHATSRTHLESSKRFFFRFTLSALADAT